MCKSTYVRNFIVVEVASNVLLILYGLNFLKKSFHHVWILMSTYIYITCVSAEHLTLRLY